jgi:hypothetical protein
MTHRQRPPQRHYTYPKTTVPQYQAHRRQQMKLWLGIGTTIALIGMVIQPRDLLNAKVPSKICTELVNPQGKISRDRLAELLKVPERSSQTTVRQILKQPYCQLPEITVRVGVAAQRDVYPLAFDPSTWLVVLYEGNEYAGYDFIVQ